MSQSEDYRQGYQAGHMAGKKAVKRPTVTHQLPMPWAAEAGFWNGDMFADWINGQEPEDEKAAYLWRFLRQWREDTRRDAVEEFKRKASKL